MRIDSNGTIPVQSNECPCKRTAGGWDMDESGIGVVAEIEGRQVEEIDDQDHLSPDEVGANKQHDECKLQQVVENEMTADTSSSLNVVIVIREEVPHVPNLEDEENKPGKKLGKFSTFYGFCIPVEGGDQSIESERAPIMQTVVAPDGVVLVMLAIIGDAIGVVKADDDCKKPCEDGQDFVGPNGLDGVRLASGEGVCWKTVRTIRSVLENLPQNSPFGIFSSRRFRVCIRKGQGFVELVHCGRM